VGRGEKEEGKVTKRGERKSGLIESSFHWKKDAGVKKGKNKVRRKRDKALGRNPL